MKTIVYIFFSLILTNFVYAQNNLYLGIDDVIISQQNTQQIKVKLKVTGATVGEYLSYKTEINQNVITLSACYFMIDAAAITYFDNDFYIDIPVAPNNYSLKVNVYYSSNETTCNYSNLDDTATLNFSTPIEGTISINTSENQTKIPQVSLYPNPVSNLLKYKTSFKTTEINIYDSSGKKITNITKPKENQIDVSQYPAGNYHIEFIGDKNKYRNKFIIRK